MATALLTTAFPLLSSHSRLCTARMYMALEGTAQRPGPFPSVSDRAWDGMGDGVEDGAEIGITVAAPPDAVTEGIDHMGDPEFPSVVSQ